MTVTTLKTKDLEKKNKGYTATDQGLNVTVTVLQEHLEDFLEVAAPFAEYITYTEVTIR